MKTKHEIRQAIKTYQPRVVEVPIPELGDVWHVRELMGVDWVQVSDDLKDWDEAHQGHAFFAARVVCDAAGNPVFTEDDIPWLADMPGPVLGRIWRIGGDLNALTAAGAADAKKNSPRSAGSSTEKPALADSPAPTP